MQERDLTGDPTEPTTTIGDLRRAVAEDQREFDQARTKVAEEMRYWATQIERDGSMGTDPIAQASAIVCAVTNALMQRLIRSAGDLTRSTATLTEAETHVS